MADIISPKDYFNKVENLESYIRVISAWHLKYNIQEREFLGGVWFRGNREVYEYPMRPGVYRHGFTERAPALTWERYRGKDDEEKRQQLERMMLAEFRISGAGFFNANNVVEVYLTAQHYGMPTRLLDWTTNPLAGLFFAVEDIEKHTKDGEVFVMEAKSVLPRPPRGAHGDNALWGPVDIRHPYVRDAICVSFWIPPQTNRPALIIPLRPDIQPGRIGQQSSCFTLHMHRADSRENETLAKIHIPAKVKPGLLNALHRMNINQFTIYNDLAGC